MKHPLFYAAVAVLLGATVGAVSQARHRDSTAVIAAHDFLNALGPDKAKKANYAFDSEERFNWHFIPKERNGVSFKDMTPAQQKAALTLLRVGVSTEGIKRLETLRQLENVLREIEKGTGPTRDPELYFFTVFGEPSDKGKWAWRYEGHHVSLQWTMVNGHILADTPQFLGANPAEVMDGPMRGTRLLAQEEDVAFDLLHSLDEAQRKEAVIDTNAPSDIVTGNSRRAAIQDDKGIAYSRLSSKQQALLEKLITVHTALQTPEIARKRMTAIRATGLNGIKFAWMGATERGKGHYYRIQGKTFLIEFDNTQNNANHIHTVWRDFNGDFGADLLAEHYRTTPHDWLAKK